jgi:hypothetical protein
MNTQNNTKTKRKTSKLTTTSCLISAIGIVVFFSYMFLLRYRVIDGIKQPYITILGVYFYILISAPLLAALGFEKIWKSEGELKGYMYGFTGIILFFLAFHLHSRTLEYVRYESHIQMCRERMLWLKDLLKKYAEHNRNEYPPPEKWCDTLLSEVKYLVIDPYDIFEKTVFKCPSQVWDSNNPSNYALNANANPHSLPDTVLLFETKGGWNQSGGHEILSCENHPHTKGCNIVFNDGTSKFLAPRHIADLNWGIEKEIQDPNEK